MVRVREMQKSRNRVLDVLADRVNQALQKPPFQIFFTENGNHQINGGETGNEFNYKSRYKATRIELF